MVGRGHTEENGHSRRSRKKQRKVLGKGTVWMGMSSVDGKRKGR